VTKADNKLELSVKSHSSSVLKPRQRFGFNHKKTKSNGLRSSQEDTQSKTASRILNISGLKAGNFAFPKRERFNEEADLEIQSQKSKKFNS
jgi:hypothetical protein